MKLHPLFAQFSKLTNDAMGSVISGYGGGGGQAVTVDDATYFQRYHVLVQNFVLLCIYSTTTTDCTATYYRLFRRQLGPCKDPMQPMQLTLVPTILIVYNASKFQVLSSRS